MKHLFLLLVLSVITIAAGARIIVTNTEYGLSAKNKTHDCFRNTRPDMKGDNVVFKGLPKNKLDFYVLDAHGKVELTGTLSRKNNMLDMAQFTNGNHTIALKQGANVKVFGWLGEVVVTAQRIVPKAPGKLAWDEHEVL